MFYLVLVDSCGKKCNSNCFKPKGSSLASITKMSIGWLQAQCDSELNWVKKAPTCFRIPAGRLTKFCGSKSCRCPTPSPWRSYFSGAGLTSKSWHLYLCPRATPRGWSATVLLLRAGQKQGPVVVYRWLMGAVGTIWWANWGFHSALFP